MSRAECNKERNDLKLRQNTVEKKLDLILARLDEKEEENYNNDGHNAYVNEGDELENDSNVDINRPNRVERPPIVILECQMAIFINQF